MYQNTPQSLTGLKVAICVDILTSSMIG